MVTSDRARNNGQKLKYWRCHLNIRKHFSTLKMTENIDPRDCEVSILEDIQNLFGHGVTESR